MLLCRPLLRQAQISRLAPLTSRRNPYSHEPPHPTEQPTTHVAVSHSFVQPPPPKVAATHLSEVDVAQLLQFLQSQRPASPPVFKPRSARPSETSVEIPKASSDSLLAYKLLRMHDIQSVAKLSLPAYIHLAEQAFVARSNSSLHYLAVDILEAFQGNRYKLNHAVEAYLALSVRYNAAFNKRTFSLLCKLQAGDYLESLSPKVVLNLTSSILPRPAFNKQLLLILTPLIIKYLRQIPDQQPNAGSVMLQPPPAFLVGCKLACKWLDLSQHQQALDVFQALLSTNYVPPEAIQKVNSLSSQDPAFLIRSVIIRSCIYWDWRLQEKRLLLDMIKATSLQDKPLYDLIVDAISALLEPPPSATDINFCAYIIRKIHLWFDDPIPDRLLLSFYESAMKANCFGAAEAVFAHTRSTPVFEKHRYPIPEGAPLTWLMRHLTVYSRNTHLGRVLATEVVETNQAIPMSDRPRFIALVATHGYGSQARALWEKYARGRDGEMVVGNAKTMVRMVSLFANVIKKATEKLRDLDPVTPGVEAREKTSHAKIEAQREKLSNLVTFTHSVIAEFRLAMPSLHHATHYELTSLARAYFLLGKVSEGLSTLKILLDRKEVPDLHDVNVALSILAKHDLPGANTIIDRMVKKGLRPDRVTIGTVLHQTVLRGDEEKIGDLIAQAGVLGRGRLTQKALSSLITNSLRDKEGQDSANSMRGKLARAMRVVKAMLAKDPRIVCTPGTGRVCIKASLRVNEPMLAFTFWKLLMRDKTEWQSQEQRSLREQIMSEIRRHKKDGRIGQNEGMMALLELEGKKKSGTATRGSRSGGEWGDGRDVSSRCG